MTPENIALAVQEVLTSIKASSQPASEILNTYTRARRYIGSKDRRTITTAVWEALRAQPWPEWLNKLIPEAEKKALKTEAKTILRANGERSTIQAELKAEGIETTVTQLSPFGLVLTKRVPLGALATYRNGHVEVQDEGSQLIALATKIRAGENVLDYCAGAGGKSLCFAQMMKNQGQIVAHDISNQSLNELKKRAKRAGVSIIKVEKCPHGTFQHVVVDAPCSGSGTWRRSPDAPFKLTPKMWKDIQKKQAHILDEAQAFVAKGGMLHYMTCSLLEDENQGQMRAFLKRYPDFKLIHHQQWTPAKQATDGFFLATFQKI